MNESINQSINTYISINLPSPPPGDQLIIQSITIVQSIFSPRLKVINQSISAVQSIYPPRLQVIHDSLIPPNLTVLLTTCAPRDPQAAIHYEIFLVVTFFAIPILVMGYNYTAIAVCLWASSNTTRHLTGQ